MFPICAIFPCTVILKKMADVLSLPTITTFDLLGLVRRSGSQNPRVFTRFYFLEKLLVCAITICVF